MYNSTLKYFKPYQEIEFIMKTPGVSIIIPLKRFTPYIREAIKYYEELDYSNFEIIILPDEKEEEVLSKKLEIRIIQTGNVGPAEKRDIGAKYAKEEILAFTDDDAYPDKNWLKNAIKTFAIDDNAAAVGGPGITPDSDSFWQRISGNVYSSFIMSGNYRKRYISSGKICEDYDLPSVNLIVKKKIFDEVGGFDSTYYPGEDTKLCLEIKKKGYKIFYNPEVIVYHHRRNLIPHHFKQIANYALHRGFFAKKYPDTSLKLQYFLPSIFLMCIIGGAFLSFLNSFFLKIYLIALGIYFLLALGSSLKLNLIESLVTMLAIFFSHLTYGLFFIKGLFFTKDLKR